MQQQGAAFSSLFSSSLEGKHGDEVVSLDLLSSNKAEIKDGKPLTQLLPPSTAKGVHSSVKVCELHFRLSPNNLRKKVE